MDPLEVKSDRIQANRVSVSGVERGGEGGALH
jgi:hypothetical protein